VPLNAVPGNIQAICKTTAPAAGSNSIVATYKGDTNYGPSTGTAAPLSVGTATATTTVAQTSANWTVDQPEIFTATISITTPASGNPQLSGIVSFYANGSPTALSTCTNLPVLASNTTTATAVCTTNTLPAGQNTLQARYTGDTQYQSDYGTLQAQVGTAASTLALSSSPLTSVFFNPNHYQDKVILTAQVSPSSGPVFLTGSVIFTYNNAIPIPECTQPVSVDSKGAAQCVTPSLPAGVVTINAAYTEATNSLGAANFSGSKNTSTQLVEDYSLSITTSTAPVIVTQGYKTSNDLFTPQTAITVSPSSIQGFTTGTGTLNLTCAVVAATSGSSPVLPGCILASKTLGVAPSGTQASVAIVIDATSASAGAYTVTVTGTDVVTGLIRSVTNPLSVTVRAASTSSTTQLNITSGATSGNTGNVSFVLPAKVTLTGFSCPWLAGTGISGAPGVLPSTLYMSCSFGSTSSGNSTSSSAQTVTLAVTVSTTGTSTAGIASHTNFLLAGLFGIPVFGLIGFLRGRRTFGSAIFRLVAIFTICIAALQVLGCSGSFQRSTTTGTNLTTPPGTYFIQVQGTGSDGNKYQAVLQVNVTL
jgi:hypothetical protein